MWEPRCVTTLWASTACYRIALPFLYRSFFPAILRCLLTNQTWSLTLREEHRLRRYEKRELWRTLGQRNYIRWRCRKMHNEELHKAQSSLNIIRMIKSRGKGCAWNVGEKPNGLLV
jgi:hypothetical protein